VLSQATGITVDATGFRLRLGEQCQSEPDTTVAGSTELRPTGNRRCQFAGSARSLRRAGSWKASESLFESAAVVEEFNQMFLRTIEEGRSKKLLKRSETRPTSIQPRHDAGQERGQRPRPPARLL